MPRRAAAAPARVQTGVRLEPRLVKVLKGLAEYLNVSLGELIELLALHAFDGGAGFSAGTRRRIAELKRIYGMEDALDHARRRIFARE